MNIVDYFNKFLNLCRIAYAFTINTFLWASLYPYMEPEDIFYAGSIDGLKYLKIQITVIGKYRSQITSFRGLILPSHKSFTDFYMQCGLGFPCILARALIALFIPGAALVSFQAHSLHFFRRSSSPKDSTLESRVKKAQKMGGIYCDIINNKNPRLVIFPEGHRNPQRTLLPLRTGTFRIAYERKLPVMLCPCEGGQTVIREKDLYVHPPTFSIRKDSVLNPTSDDPQDEANTNKLLLKNHLTSPDFIPPPSSHYCRTNLRGVVVINACAIIDPTKFNSWEEFKEECERLFAEGYKEACSVWDNSVEEMKTEEPSSTPQSNSETSVPAEPVSSGVVTEDKPDAPARKRRQSTKKGHN